MNGGKDNRGLKRFKLLRPSPANARGSEHTVLKGGCSTQFLQNQVLKCPQYFANVCTQPLWELVIVFNTFEDDPLRLIAIILNKFSRHHSPLRHPIPSEPSLLQRPCFSFKEGKLEGGVSPWVPEQVSSGANSGFSGTSSLHFSIETVLQRCLGAERTSTRPCSSITPPATSSPPGQGGEQFLFSKDTRLRKK